MMAAVMGRTRLKAATPATGMRTRMISSEA